MRFEAEGDRGDADADASRRHERDGPGDDRRARDDRAAGSPTGRRSGRWSITGEGRAFSAGGDVNWFRRGIEDPDADLVQEVRHGADVLHQAIVDFKRIPYPVIAAVNGPAAGAGFSLALMCDIRIASDRSFFACAYGRIGASPDGGMTYFLPRVIGPAAAAELMLEDPNLSAARARARPRLRGRRSRGAAPRRRREGGRAGREITALPNGWSRSWSGRASTTRWPTTSSSSATGSPTRWAPRTSATASRDFLAGEQPAFHGR